MGMLSRMKDAVTRALTRLGRFWRPRLDLWKVLTLCRFSILTVVVVAIGLICVDEGREVLFLLQDPQQPWYIIGLMNAGFVAAGILWIWLVWYWSRVILSFQFPDWPPQQGPDDRLAQIRRMHRVVPGILGFAAFVAVDGAVIVSFSQYTHPLQHWMPIAVLAVLNVTALGLYRALKRRQWFELALPEPGLKALYYTHKQFWLSPTHRRLLLGSLLGWLLIFLVFQYRPLNLWLAPKISAPTILLLAAASWVPLGTFLVYVGSQYRIPVLTLLLIWAGIISLGNDNHPVRQLAQSPVAASSDGRPLVRDHFKQWLKIRGEEARYAGHQGPVPVLIVAAEGGGIRAAYWTASVLARIQQDRQEFARHLFAISGVSGGSLGAAVFTALVAGRGPHARCPDPQLLPCTRNMLKEDFLAPTLATMLFPELLQRFLPFPVPYWDRAWTLEAAWEKAWFGAAANRRFEQDFYELWQNDSKVEVPSLILNSTSAEEGNRILTSNMKIHEKPTGDHCLEEFFTMASGPFKDVYDHHHELHLRRCNDGEQATYRTIALSTAANGSARFSFISPAGRVNRDLHIVDGGYFENSGATTAEEIVLAIKDIRIDNVEFLPIVVHISNEPELTEVAGVIQSGPVTVSGKGLCIRLQVSEEVASRFDEAELCEKSPPKASGPIVSLQIDGERYRGVTTGSHVAFEIDKMNRIIGFAKSKPWVLAETLTPLRALYMTREGRGAHAVKHLQALVEPELNDHRFFHFGLRTGEIALPLGWTLSKSATQEMDEQLRAAFAGGEFRKSCKEKAKTLHDYFQNCWPRKTVL